MNKDELFTAGNDGLVPLGDVARQAVDSLRGYAYQVTAAALAWLDLDEGGRLYLEVAEDYAVVVHQAIETVQVKDTEASGSVTLNTGSVRDAVSDFVSLTASNPNVDVHLRYFTTSEIGTERAVNERPGGMAGLAYWRNAATGADVGPLRSILESDKFSAAVQKFVKDREDEALRRDMLRKIHWDCGKPDLASLRKEFELRLVVVGRDVFNLPAPEATRIADALIYRVLEKSIAKNSADRVLTRADLYLAADHATRIFVPRAMADMLALISSGLTTSALAGLGAGLPVAVAEPGWLVAGSSLPLAKDMVPRTAIEADIADRLRRLGTSIVTGASGLGKSSVARAVARKLANEFVIVDFRNSDSGETRSRLDAMVSRIGGLTSSIVIFEDLNHLNDPLVAPAMARVFEALRRRDRAAIVTCYLPPTARALSTAGLNAGCRVECRYFTESEAAELVTVHGGDPKVWGRLSYVTGAFGHPQLVHAFIVGMAARGWPRSEVMDIVGAGLSTGDIDSEREAARRTLVSVLPENARNLLYRLSLTIGRFDRAMALTVANAPPPLARAGECMDALIGPWLETVGRDSYRVSPLAARSGQGMMSSAEQASIHSAIATQFMESATINVDDVDVIILHAMLGKNERVLFALAHSILISDERTIGLLVDNLTAFKLLRTDTPIYPDNLRVSGMLRIAQFKILVAAEETDKIAECVHALFSETEQQPDGEMRHAFRALSFAVVLSTMGIANYLDNWLDLLQQFQAITEADEFPSGIQNNFEEKGKQSSNLFGLLFAIGSASPSTVAKLESVINQLDEVDPARHTLYLNAIGEIAPDYSVFINSAWTLERRHGALNASDAAERYRRMAIKTVPWAIRAISIQCRVAQSVMLDEYTNDREGALKVLDDAVEALGDDVLLSRARAKIYWRAQDHERALAILRDIADEVGRDNHVERAFALREAAISAAKCGEWAQAEKWFLESKEAAAQCQLPDMIVMSVGLGADAAVAALQIEQVKRALTGLRDALADLMDIDPGSSLRAAYCHQVVRHTVLWAQARIDRNNLEIDGEPITIVPGCCSNPEPLRAVTERLLGPIDLAWYMLAGSEVSSGENVSIADNLNERLASGPIPTLELDLRARRVTRDVTDLNAPGFAHHLWSYAEAVAHLFPQAQQVGATLDMLEPLRGAIPAALRIDLSHPVVSAVVSDAVFAYLIIAACEHSAEGLSDLSAALKARFGGDIAGATLSRATTKLQLPPAASFDDALVDSVRSFKSDASLTPLAYGVAAIRFVQQASRSRFKTHLISAIASWQRKAWTRIVGTETFRLSRPQKTVPAIEAALSIANDDERFLGALCPAVAGAIGVTLSQEMLGEFANLAAVSPAA
ncbi:AAA family ATPase [Cupriavidus sp. 30B13]|uniref:AAA family ATPase n=1 Tax=Cupriavidus sp. 30B13 TaxID=3384241 RepID=UPI003B91A4E5